VIAWPKDGEPLAGDVTLRLVDVLAVVVPLPLSVTCVDDALLASVSVSESAPVASGVKVAPSSQLEPLAIVPPAVQMLEPVEDTLKSPVLPLAV
jgi:hypothetical protein